MIVFTIRIAHERYQAIYDLIHMRDKEMATAFDSLSRSKALFHLDTICSNNLLKPEELAQFGREIQKSLRLIKEPLRA